MDSLLSFPVGLFHPLQHAGLARRTTSRRQSGQKRNFPHPDFWLAQPKSGLVRVKRIPIRAVRKNCRNRLQWQSSAPQSQHFRNYRQS